jgi:hypothetical protein
MIAVARGWIEERVAPARDHAFRASRIAAPASSALMRDLSPVIAEQGYTSSCVAQAACTGVRMVLALDSVHHDEARIEAPARRFVYREARATHGDAFDDAGTYNSAALFVLRTEGWPAERHMPWDDAIALLDDTQSGARNVWINEAPSQTVRYHAADQAGVVRERAVLAFDGDDLEAQLRAALTVRPVLCGGAVTTDFQELVSWDPCDMRGPVAGGHAVLLVGYDEEGYHVRNSWGAGWGVGGIARVTPRVVRQVLRNFYVIDRAEGPTS